jgi:hypothetical protein
VAFVCLLEHTTGSQHFLSRSSDPCPQLGNLDYLSRRQAWESDGAVCHAACPDQAQQSPAFICPPCLLS